MQDAPTSGSKIYVVTPQTIEEASDIVDSDPRYTGRQIANIAGISEGSARTILKKKLGLRRKTARWIPHLLTNEQKRKRVLIAKKLLKLYPKFDRRVFADIVTGDETWVHFFEPQRKMNNKIWATKQGRRPVIAKRLLSAKKIMMAIFFNINGPVIQIAVPKGRSVTGKFYKCKVLKKLRKYFVKRRPASGLRGVRLLHDNAPAHTSLLVVNFLEREKVKVIPHPPYSPDLAPADFFLFPRLKKMLSGRKYTNRSGVGSAVYQCLRLIPKSDYERAFRSWLQRLKCCILHNGDYFEGNKLNEYCIQEFVIAFNHWTKYIARPSYMSFRGKKRLKDGKCF